MKEKLGFIGLGLMGSAMAQRFLEAGFPLSLYNRTKEKANALLDREASWCSIPAEVAEVSDYTFSMVSDSEALTQISMGQTEIFSTLPSGGVHIDCSTVSPLVTSHLAREYKSKEAFFIHCPVLGSVPQVRDGTLLLFAGGEERIIKKIEHILTILGSMTWRFPQPEQASHTKLLCNLFIGGMITTLAQALVSARRANVSQKTLLEIIGQSALNAPMYQTKGQSILEKNFGTVCSLKRCYMQMQP